MWLFGTVDYFRNRGPRRLSPEEERFRYLVSLFSDVESKIAGIAADVALVQAGVDALQAQVGSGTPADVGMTTAEATQVSSDLDTLAAAVVAVRNDVTPPVSVPPSDATPPVDGSGA